jgi:hypothetical protein
MEMRLVGVRFMGYDRVGNMRLPNVHESTVECFKFFVR